MVKGCGKKVGPSPESYWYSSKGEFEDDGGYWYYVSPYLEQTKLPKGTCGEPMGEAVWKLCERCCKKAGLLW
jgi:hypothetical protein